MQGKRKLSFHTFSQENSTIDPQFGTTAQYTNAINSNIGSVSCIDNEIIQDKNINE